MSPFFAFSFLAGIFAILLFINKTTSHITTAQKLNKEIFTLNSCEFDKILKNMIGYDNEEFYLFSDDPPIIKLNGDLSFNSVCFSLIVPVSGDKQKYCVYQVCIEKQGLLYLSKGYEVINPSPTILMTSFWDSIRCLPISVADAQVEKKGDQYMITLLNDSLTIKSANANQMIENEKLFLYNNDGLKSDVDFSRSTVCWVVLPLYYNDNDRGLSGHSNECYIFCYALF